MFKQMFFCLIYMTEVVNLITSVATGVAMGDRRIHSYATETYQAPAPKRLSNKLLR